MTEKPDQDRVRERADLLPEEQASGSVDAQEQAAIVLEDSDERTEDPEGTKHRSVQTPE